MVNLIYENFRRRSVSRPRASMTLRTHLHGLWYVWIEKQKLLNTAIAVTWLIHGPDILHVGYRRFAQQWDRFVISDQCVGLISLVVIGIPRFQTVQQKSVDLVCSVFFGIKRTGWDTSSSGAQLGQTMCRQLESRNALARPHEYFSDTSDHSAKFSEICKAPCPDEPIL